MQYMKILAILRNVFRHQQFSDFNQSMLAVQGLAICASKCTFLNYLQTVDLPDIKLGTGFTHIIWL